MRNKLWPWCAKRRPFNSLGRQRDLLSITPPIMPCASTWRVNPWRRLPALINRERLRFISAAAQSALPLLDASSAWSGKPDCLEHSGRLFPTDSFELPLEFPANTRCADLIEHK